MSNAISHTISKQITEKRKTKEKTNFNIFFELVWRENDFGMIKHVAATISGKFASKSYRRDFSTV